MGEHQAETNQLHVVPLAAEKRSRRVLRLDFRVVPEPRLILHRPSLKDRSAVAGAAADGGAVGGVQERTFSFCAPGVTYPAYDGLWDMNGVSACMINGTQNGQGGNALNSQFYVPLWILNKDPFYVRIDP